MYLQATDDLFSPTYQGVLNKKNLTNYGVRRSHAHIREDLHQHKGKNTKPDMMISIDSKGFMLRDNIHAKGQCQC